jgi:hypothetical protein
MSSTHAGEAEDSDDPRFDAGVTVTVRNVPSSSGQHLHPGPCVCCFIVRFATRDIFMNEFWINMVTRASIERLRSIMPGVLDGSLDQAEIIFRPLMKPPNN